MHAIGVSEHAGRRVQSEPFVLPTVQELPDHVDEFAGAVGNRRDEIVQPARAADASTPMVPFQTCRAFHAVRPYDK